MPRQTEQEINHFPHFKKIAITFIILAIILLLFIVYFSFAKATINLSLKDAPEQSSFVVTAAATTTPSDIYGYTFKKELVLEKKFNTQNYKEEAGTAKGQIKIINNSSRNQPLIATTRFLSPNNILFRLENGVTVPAGDSDVADVYADEEGKEFDIAPTRFTIPGLSESLQEIIYGVSEKPMSGGVKKIGILSENDVEVAKTQMDTMLKDLVIEKIKTELPEAFEANEGLVSVSLIEYSIENEVGDEVGEFVLSARVDANGVAVNSSELLEKTKDKYKKQLGEAQEVIKWDLDSFKYELDSFNNDMAYIKTYLTANVNGSFNFNNFDKTEISGFDEKGVEYYFSQFQGVDGVQVNFWPFWVKSVPALKDRIEIKIN